MIIRIALKKLGADIRAFAISFRDRFRGKPELVKQVGVAKRELQCADDEVAELENQLRLAQERGVEIAAKQTRDLEASIQRADEEQKKDQTRNDDEVKAVRTSAEEDIKTLVMQMRIIRAACKDQVARIQTRHSRIEEQFTKDRATAVLSVEEARRMQAFFADECNPDLQESQDSSQD